MVAVVLGSAVVFLDSTLVNVALPQIGKQLPTHFFGVLEAQSYVYTGYLLALSGLLILGGVLSDRHGRRRMFAIGLSGFGVTSLAAGLAPTMELLVLLRVLQGATAAILVPGSISIITSSFDGEDRGRAFGIWAGASAATTILGPFLGGALVDSFSWRVAFLINVPILAVALYATLRHMPESRGEQIGAGFDWMGAAAVTLAVGGLTLGAIRGQEQEWRDPLAYGALGAGAGAAAGAPFLLRRARHPLVPFVLFRSRNFTVTNLSTLLIYAGVYLLFYYPVLFTQGALGYTASAAGLAPVPALTFLVLFSSRVGRLAARRGPKVLVTIGPAVMALGLLLFVRVPSTSEPWVLRPADPASWAPPLDYVVHLLPGFAVFGLGLMAMVAPLTTALMASVPPEHAGCASALNNAISRVGPQLAGALIFVAITAGFYADLGRAVPGVDVSSSVVRRQLAPLNAPPAGASPATARAALEASTRMFHLAMGLAAGLVAAGGAVNAIGIRDSRGELPRLPPKPQSVAR